MAELVWQYVLFVALALLVVPLLGGALLWGAFTIAKISQFSFRDCWKVYLTACCFAYLLLMGVQLVWRNDPAVPMARVAVFMATTVLAVPVLLRVYTRRVLVCLWLEGSPCW